MPFAGSLKKVSDLGLEKSAKHLIGNLESLESCFIKMCAQTHDRQFFGNIDVGLLNQFYAAQIIGHRPGSFDPLRPHLKSLRSRRGEDSATFF